MFTLSPEQGQIADRVAHFIQHDSGHYFVVHGLAGTGKTTLLSAVAREFPAAKMIAPTGKAAAVLRQKTGMRVTTVHSYIYRFAGEDVDDDGTPLLRFARKHKDEGLTGDVVLLDEASMVSVDMAMDLLRTGCRVIAVGDPGQLPPVKGAQFFDSPDGFLSQIHRQALDNPINRQAHRVRNGDDYQADGFRFRVERRASDADIVEADVILTFTNNTRAAANREARRVRGLWQPYPLAGEPVVCLRNSHRHGVFNGEVYTLVEPFTEGSGAVFVEVNGKIVCIQNAVFTGVKHGLLPGTEPVTSFDYGYAMTVHKSQGSEWAKVIVVDECRRPDMRKQWLYTALTRASEQALVLGGLK
jgi:exodeoxyribonuclease-5